MIEIILTGGFTLLAVIITSIYNKKLELQKIEENKKLELQKMEENRKIMEENRKFELEKFTLQLKAEEENKRREFLVTVITNEKNSMNMRKAAATEYLEKKYNGTIKAYIYDNFLVDPKEVDALLNEQFKKQ